MGRRSLHDRLPSYVTFVRGFADRLRFVWAHESGRDLRWLLFVGVASTLLCLPFLRAIAWLGDEGILIHGAERSMRGHKLYLDTFDFFPQAAMS